MSLRRIGYIDFLKTLGLLLLILAHVDAPAFILQLRCFDVPLMVILSGILAKDSYKRYLAKNKPDYPLFDKGFFWKRIVRLLIPTYIFLTIFFIIMAALGKTYTAKDIIYSYLLQSGNRGIGYVWIILVYLLCAIEIPFLYKLSIKSLKVVIGVIIVYGSYELMAHYHIGLENILFYSIFYYAVPYGVLTLIGMNYDELGNVNKKIIFFSCLGVFLALFTAFYIKTGAVKNMAIFKYPPRIYFLSYGLFVSMLLIEIVSKKNLNLYSTKPVQFVSKSSLWIYLWHILFLNVFDLFGVFKCWWIRFVLLVILSCTVTFAQNALLDMLARNGKYKSWMRVFRG